MVYILLADGFEEAEAIVPADLLRRAGAQVALVGVTGTVVTGAHGVAVTADVSLEQVDPSGMEMLVVPGGYDGVTNIGRSSAAKALIQTAADTDGCTLAAICAAPSLLLGPMGILKGRKAVCYPGMEETMTGADVQKGQSVVVDGDLITGEGPGAAFAFGLKLAETLKGRETAAQVAHDTCWRH